MVERLDAAAETADALAAEVLERLRAAGRWLACAESCTGGLIASRLTSVSKSSRAFRGGVVCYHPEAKVRLLDVAPGAVAFNDAVNAEVAKGLAKGACWALHADYGIGVTGFAEHDEQAKRGLVFLGLAHPDGRTEVRERKYDGSRDAVRRQAATEALEWLRDTLPPALPAR